jgi:hypothetical protein
MCRKVTLHTYLPRLNLEYRSWDGLDLYTDGATFDTESVPRHLIIQLNLFAGQLYFNLFEEYVKVCEFLGLAWKAMEDGIEVQPDGFIVDGRGTAFTKSPVHFMRVLMAKIRRNGEAIEKTHMGRMLEGECLEKDSF